MKRASFFVVVLILVVSLLAVTMPQTAMATTLLKEEFSGSTLPPEWFVHTYHGTYSLADGHLNLRSTDAIDWASVSVQRDFSPDINGFQLRARVRYNGGYGVYFGLFVSNQIVDLSNIPRAGGVFENTIAISNTYDGFYNGLRHLGSTTFPTFLSAAVVGNWYILELDVSKNPFKVTANVYDDNNILVGSASRTDMILKYSEISICGAIAYRGVISSDSLANYDVDWIKAENFFEDGFESGSFNAWTSTTVTSGETASVVSTTQHHGIYAARFTSNGGGKYENAYCYQNVTGSEVYTRGYFYVSQSGIDANNDRFFFVVFRANGNNGLAYAGWKMTGGTVKWCITMRDGTSYPDVFSDASRARAFLIMGISIA